MSRIEAVSVVYQLIPTDTQPSESAIDKRPVLGPQKVGRFGLTQDSQCDAKFHGGVDRALYAYAAEDLAWWSTELGRELTPGCFGENLTTSGVQVSGAVIGEQWRIGSSGLVVEVSCARFPCNTFAKFVDQPQWVKRFTEHGAPGAYLRVLKPGFVSAGDSVELLSRPDHGVTVADTFHRLTPETAARIMSFPGLEVGVRASAERVLGRTQPDARPDARPDAGRTQPDARPDAGRTQPDAGPDADGPPADAPAGT